MDDDADPIGRSPARDAVLRVGLAQRFDRREARHVSACLECWAAPVVIHSRGRCQACYARMGRRLRAGLASWQPRVGEGYYGRSRRAAVGG